MHSSLGSWDPEDCLVSVINDPEEAVRALDDLRAGAFEVDDVHLFLAQEVIGIDSAIIDHRGFLKKVVYAVTNISDDAALAEDYLNQARQGHQILVVHAPDIERAKQAYTIIKRHHAHQVRYYGRWVVRDLISPA